MTGVAITSAPASRSATRACVSKPLLRRFPYPYRAMLAICSDLDETPNADVYLDIMRFLNTRQPTSMGPGVDLEVGNTIYFDMPPDQFAYWNTDDAGRAMVRDLIQSGHIDCLHSYGDLATTRGHAARAIEELVRHDCRLEVWIDHSKAPSNFGSDIMMGSGDVHGSPVYHADLTCDYGVKYVWRGRVTSVIGQGVRRSLRGVFDSDHPTASLATIVKEGTKGVLASCGNRKYAMHGRNDLMREARLRDGRGVCEFLRSNPHWSGPGGGATAAGLGDVLSEAFLERLMAQGGYCLLYTHMGKIDDPSRPFSVRTRKALERLANYHRDGRILVTTTKRLLDYHRALAAIDPVCSSDVDGDRIDIANGDHEARGTEQFPQPDRSGITFYHSGDRPCRVFVRGRELTHLQQNPPDKTGRASISFPWVPLAFPDV